MLLKPYWKTWVKGISSKGYCQLETREVFNTQLIDKGVSTNKNKSPLSCISTFRTEKPPLYDVGVLLGLRGNIAPPGQKIKMVMRD